MSEPTTTEAATPPKVDSPTAPKKFTKEQIRDAFLSAKPKSKEIQLFGVMVYLREPPTEVVLGAQALEDRKMAIGQLMTQYLFTADGEQVFDEADIDGLLNMPFGDDMRRLNQAINELLGVTPTEADKSPAAE